MNDYTVVIATGGFDPIHSGHIAYLNEAKKLGNILYVGVNSDAWLVRKKGKEFMNWNERALIVSNLKCVDSVVEFDDFDGSAKDAIAKVRKLHPHQKIIFANGGDRVSTNIPEMHIKDSNIKFVFSVGGDYKMNSSSWILKSWKN